MKHFKYIDKNGIENNIGDLKGRRIEEAPWIIKKDKSYWREISKYWKT